MILTFKRCLKCQLYAYMTDMLNTLLQVDYTMAQITLSAQSNSS